MFRKEKLEIDFSANFHSKLNLVISLVTFKYGKTSN